MVERLCETSFLVYFSDRQMKLSIATLVSFVSLALLRDFKPWIHDSDDNVAHAAAWVLFFWVYALACHEALSGYHGAMWGIPLVLGAVGLVVYTFYMIYVVILRLFESEGAVPWWWVTTARDIPRILRTVLRAARDWLRAPRDREPSDDAPGLDREPSDDAPGAGCGDDSCSDSTLRF